MKSEFKPYYCCDCGKQAMVTDTQGRKIKALVGTKEIWLCLCDPAGHVMSRIGQLHLCEDCDIKKVNPSDIADNVINSRFSGVKLTSDEAAFLPNLKLELIKTYGD